MGSSRKKRKMAKTENEKTKNQKRFSGQQTRYTRIQCILINLGAVLTQCCCLGMLFSSSPLFPQSNLSWYVSMFVCLFFSSKRDDNRKTKRKQQQQQ